MKVLIIGGSGQEHALAWKLRQTLQREDVFVAPGNGGTQRIALNIRETVDDAGRLVETVKRWGIEFVMVGDAGQMEPGVADRLHQEGLPVFGASAAAKQLGSHQPFLTQLLTNAGVPVLSIPSNDKAIGGSLTGLEFTAFAFTDGISVSSVVAACEDRRTEEGDRGPETEGAGGYSPPLFWTPSLADQVRDTILGPIVRTLRAAGTPYSGILGADFVLTESGPRVVGLRPGLGDPAAQIIIPRLQTDLLEVTEAILAGNLEQLTLRWSPDATVAVVLTAKGSPSRYETGKTVTFTGDPASLVFHGETVVSGYYIYTTGERVATVVGRGRTLAAARQQAYDLAESVQIEGVQYRRDIAPPSSQ